MGNGAGAARGSKYRGGPPQAPAQQPRRRSSSVTAQDDALRARCRAARRAVQRELRREAEGVLRAWGGVEEELGRLLAERGPKGGAEEAQAQSMLRAAVLVRDSTQLGLALRNAAARGLRSRAMGGLLEALLAREEAEGLWCCLSTALLEADCVSLACWLEEARAKDLRVPSEVLEFWLEAMRAAGLEEDGGHSRRSAAGLEYEELFESRVAEAHARGDRGELRRLLAEARRLGGDAAAAEAALIALEADSAEATSSRPRRRRGSGDPELDALRGWGERSMEAEFAALGKDIEAARSQAEMLRALRGLGRAAAAPPPAAAAPSAAPRRGSESPRARLARTLEETRQGPGRRPSGPPPAGAGEAATGESAKDYPRAWGGAARERARPAERPGGGEDYPRAWSGAARERVRRPSREGAPAGAEADSPGARGEEREDEAPPARRPPAALSREEALEVLGLAEGASEEDVRRAYKRAALRWHPDRQHNHERQAEATEAFQRARAALEVLRAA